MLLGAAAPTFARSRVKLAALGLAGLLILSSRAALGAATESPAVHTVTEPVVLELFTSEGCSSCPPADELLAQLDAAGEVAGTPVIALEMHVDYWDYLGWKDPFSSAVMSQRQQRYAALLGARGPYTPQVMVDGAFDALGSSRARVEAAIAASRSVRSRSKVHVQLARSGDVLSVKAAGLPKDTPLIVLLAVTERKLQTKVTRGENAGRTLLHGPVVRQWKVLAKTAGPQLGVQAPLSLAADWNQTALRAVVLLQAESDGHIVGAAALSL